MKFKLNLLIAVLGLAAVTLLGGPGDLPKKGLTGSTHDINSNGCKSCHAPHNGAIANGGTDGSTGALLLWSRSVPSVAAYGVYDSPNMDLAGETPKDVADAAAGAAGGATLLKGDVRMYSLLCLSCHDGITSTVVKNTVNMVGSNSSFGGGAYQSFGLTNDHPVNMPYSPTLNPSLAATTTVSGVVTVPGASASGYLPLYGSTSSVQCATCHDPHNNANTNYLRLPYAGSGPGMSSFCVSCHI